MKPRNSYIFFLRILARRTLSLVKERFYLRVSSSLSSLFSIAIFFSSSFLTHRTRVLKANIFNQTARSLFPR